MRAFAAVFRMEMAEKRNVFIAAAATAVLPFLTVFQSRGVIAAGELRNVAAYTLLVVFVEVIAVLLGVTMIGTELSGGRLSFYFARPIKPFSLWCGKLAGALAAIAISGIIIIGPVVASGDFAWPTNDWLEVRNFFFFTLGVLLASHTLSVIRSKSSWLAFDLVGAIVFVALVWLAASPLMMAGARETITVAALLGLLTLMAIFVASAMQLARGRTDRATSHAVFSISLWSMLVLAAIGCDGYSWWYTHPGISDLGSIQMASAPASGWVGVSGRAFHRDMNMQPAFLLQPDTGRAIPLGLSRRLPPITSQSGMIVGFRADGSVWYLDGRKPGASIHDLAIRTTLNFSLTQMLYGDVNRFGFVGGVLSDDGSRLALVEGLNLGVYTLPHAKLISATTLPDTNHVPRLFFRSDDDLELLQPYHNGDRTTVEVTHLMTSTKRVIRSTIYIPGKREPERVYADGTGERFTIFLSPPPQIALIDVGSGNSIFQSQTSTTSQPNFIDGNRFTVREGSGNATLFRLLDRDGRTVSSFPMPLGPGESASISRITPRGNLAVRLTDYALRKQGANPIFSVAIVNPTTGQVLRRIENVVPAVNAFWTLDPRALPPSSSEYFIDSTNGSLLQIDPDTGSRRVLIKASGLQIPFD